MTITTERQQFAEQNGMTMEFVDWFFDEKKDGCGAMWFTMAAAMWEGWKGKELLAARWAVPVAYLTWHQGCRAPDDCEEYFNAYPHKTEERSCDGTGAFPVYTAPPAPAVPEVLEKMLAIVRSPRALPRRKEWISGQQYSYVLLENVEAIVEDACRAAMLGNGNSTEIPEGWKLVPVEPTESMLLVLGMTGSFESMTAKYQKMLAAAPEVN